MNGVMDVVKVSDVRIRKSNLCVKRKQQKLINFSWIKKSYIGLTSHTPTPGWDIRWNFGGQPRGQKRLGNRGVDPRG